MIVSRISRYTSLENEMYEEKLKKILNAIKVKRSDLGYTQQYMAKELGISQNMYSKIELDKAKITTCKYLMICELLQMDPYETLN